ncbi:hypothetical protein HPB47_001284 [Ixodes persulcatus]|uniref:Uncharacterized protein n=1 Tax=Ixodes persulcatus TaxID=34615 RepID=A0AC60PQ69_IXOPE|nr:hypothetical protein HPB47_001284 [Ixodes persulcatus]
MLRQGAGETAERAIDQDRLESDVVRSCLRCSACTEGERVGRPPPRAPPRDLCCTSSDSRRGPTAPRLRDGADSSGHHLSAVVSGYGRPLTVPPSSGTVGRWALFRRPDRGTRPESPYIWWRCGELGRL